MNADTFRTLAVVFLALAVIFAAVAVILYRRFDIPAVRDELSGRAARREIEALRGTRAGQWEHADDIAARGGRSRAAGAPVPAGGAGKGVTGRGTGSDMEFRQATGSTSGASGTGPASGSGSSPSGQRSTDAGATHRLPAAPGSAPVPRPAGAPAKAGDNQPVIEIPVAMASAAELADEGETSLMQFRKPDENVSDDDESRTILVHAAKHAAPADTTAKKNASNESKSNR